MAEHANSTPARQARRRLPPAFTTPGQKAFIIGQMANAYLVAMAVCGNPEANTIDNDKAAAFLQRCHARPVNILDAFQEALDMAVIGGAV